MLVSFFILFANECGGGSLGYYKKLKPLIDSGDIRCLPALVEACDFYWAKRNREIEVAMTKLLNMVSSKDAGLFSMAQQNKLWHVATQLWRENEYLHEEFALAAIHALTQVGKAEMIPKFRQLAGRNVLYNKQQHLIEVAGEMLPILEARLQAQNVPETLLRSYIPPSVSDELLRPASSTMKNFPDLSTQLLRPTAGQSSAPDAPKE